MPIGVGRNAMTSISFNYVPAGGLELNVSVGEGCSALMVVIQDLNGRHHKHDA